jgi:hypothetical protein
MSNLLVHRGKDILSTKTSLPFWSRHAGVTLIELASDEITLCKDFDFPGWLAGLGLRESVVRYEDRH